MSIASEPNRCLASNMISTGDAASMLGVCKKTMYRWEESGKLLPAFRTPGNHRRYDRRVILVLIRQHDDDDGSSDEVEVTRSEAVANAAIYARVSSTRQKQSGDLDRQASTISSYCEGRGFRVSRVYSDVGSGINDGRRGLMKLLKDVARGHHDVVVVNYQDRLSRFGVNVIWEFLSSWGVKLVVVNKSIDVDDPNAELIEDLMSILYSFMGRIYRKRRGKHVGRPGP